jgi:hypothetical protein
MPSTTTPWATALLLVCAATTPVAAQTTGPLPGSNATPARGGFSQPIAAAELARHRGGTQIVKNDVTLAGTTANNTAQQVSTGNNDISAGSFSNMNGIPVVIQNSGANVLIQNAVVLHLQLQ